MHLTVDMGNTNIKLAFYENDERIAYTRFDTRESDYEEVLKRFFVSRKVDKVDDIIVSCVTPSIKEMFFSCLSEYCDNEIIEVNYLYDLGIKINTPTPEKVGNDLLVMSSYAYHLYQKACLCLSFGTATVFCYTDKDGNYSYAAIAPGFQAAANSLWEKADQLPRINLAKKDNILANTTLDAMNVGIVDGYIGLCSHIIDEFKKELGEDMAVIATGGQGKIIVPYLNVDKYETDFVSSGLNYLYTRCK